MKDQTKRDILILCDAASRMRTAANMLWWAHNPDEDVGAPGDPPTVEEAQFAHSEAFNALSRAEYYARRAIERDGD